MGLQGREDSAAGGFFPFSLCVSQAGVTNSVAGFPCHGACLRLLLYFDYYQEMFFLAQAPQLQLLNEPA